MKDSSIIMKTAWRIKDRPVIGDEVMLTKSGRVKKVYRDDPDMIFGIVVDDSD